MSQVDTRPQVVADYQLSVDEVLVRHQTATAGLPVATAAVLLSENGPNVLALERRRPWWRHYLDQFADWMILLLLASAVISTYLGDLHTAVVLIALVLFNTVIGFLQEYRAEKTMEALERLVQPEAQVFRGGRLTVVPSAELVVSDVIRLSEGDLVPADVRLIELSGFATNDFALTGESNPSRKFTHAIDGPVPMANRHNLAYMGTTVATGEALGVVIATGANTELGRIATLSQATKRDLSPLQREIRHIATLVTYGVVGLAVVFLVIALAIELPLKDALLFAVGVASALVPQGLPAEVNTSLAQAAGKLAKANALVKRLSAVESLGATQVICTDKTGTLTRNEMTVVGAFFDGVAYEVSGSGYGPDGRVARADGKAPDESDRVREFFRIGRLASNARVLPPDEHSPVWYCLGDPTEGALVVASEKAGVAAETPAEVREFPFDSGRKRMTSLRAEGGSLRAYVKGAPESVLARSDRIRSGGVVRPLTDDDREAFRAEYTRRAEQALRNLAFATRDLDPGRDPQTLGLDEVEADLVLEGLVSMVDPLRDSVPDAMAAAAGAHVAVNVVTGDFATTALAIARKAGVAPEGHEPRVISSEELHAAGDDEVREATLRGGVVFSRVSPEDKMRIVGLARDAGAIVAVTGDGINDAPALKRADIGVAMGLTGTEVAKQAAEVVLLDDSFATLVEAIRRGRTIFSNITKGIQSCFTTNFAELFTAIGSLTMVMVWGFPLALNVLQILAIDLLAELFPIAALGWDREEGETMKQPPRDPTAHILNRTSIPDIAWCGFLIGGFALTNNLLSYARLGVDPTTADSAIVARATTVTFLTIIACQLVNIMQRRSVHGLFTRYQFSNRWFWVAVAFSVGIMLSISYLPGLSTFFSSGPVGLLDWASVLGAAALFVTIREIQRVLHLLWAPGPWAAQRKRYPVPVE